MNARAETCPKALSAAQLLLYMLHCFGMRQRHSGAMIARQLDLGQGDPSLNPYSDTPQSLTESPSPTHLVGYS